MAGNKRSRAKGVHTLDEIGGIMGITAERARQILVRAEKKLVQEARRQGIKRDDFMMGLKEE